MADEKKYAAPSGVEHDHTEEAEVKTEEVSASKSKSRKSSKVTVVLRKYGSWTDPQTGDEYVINQPVEVDKDVAERLLGLGRQGGRIFDKASN